MKYAEKVEKISGTKISEAKISEARAQFSLILLSIEI